MKYSSFRQSVASILSLLLAVVVSSHHWLHMALLYTLGGSMASMAQFLWLRRFMIVVVLAMTGFTLYRFFRRHRSHAGSHRRGAALPLALHLASAALSIGFVVYTLLTFGW
ncbi:hypothetical protein [Paenibacillus flagellatus]|uniref:Uncharacterized protein n=1 Tax=Paenibacillus flagellatus TaxID=2211139 RepID=A0A2V5K183_9BACL|nr:hypothetical protein [Paenibacillus flagellatus]PYI52851.1 hypothetical protein DLM86_17735 [Paenibacillus flagellatus]